MAAKKFIRVALTALLTLMLVVSVFPICTFATDEVLSVSTGDADVAVLVAEAPENDAEAPSDGDEVEEVVIDAADIIDSEDTEENADDAEESGDAEDAPAEDKKITTGEIVSIAIVALIVIIAAVYCIKNKEKVAKFFRECKSELKKIVWTPWKQVKKNAVVVIIIVIICAVVIGVLDFVFSKGIIALGDLI